MRPTPDHPVTLARKLLLIERCSLVGTGLEDSPGWLAAHSTLRNYCMFGDQDLSWLEIRARLPCQNSKYTAGWVQAFAEAEALVLRPLAEIVIRRKPEGSATYPGPLRALTFLTEANRTHLHRRASGDLASVCPKTFWDQLPGPVSAGIQADYTVFLSTGIVGGGFWCQNL